MKHEKMILGIIISLLILIAVYSLKDNPKACMSSQDLSLLMS